MSLSLPPDVTREPSTISFQPVSEKLEASYQLIFFITGNPGLISYYNTFLSTVDQLLYTSPTKSKADVFHIYGQSLAGFEQNDKVSAKTSAPWSLEDQIEILFHALNTRVIPSGPQEGQDYASIILVGHSVGAYIVMEILKRLRKTKSHLKVKGSILLFPTVTHIAKSSSGIKFSSLFRVPNFPRGLSIAARVLLWPLPRPTIKWLVGLVTGMPDEGAEATTRFLTSSMGVWQALHLARDEMESITQDRWDDDIWGVEHNNGKITQSPKLIFYFGKHDHWVSSHIRDELIAARGRNEGNGSSSKPLMLIDENEVPHSFCIDHSEQIAEKVKLWVEDILELH